MALFTDFDSTAGQLRALVGADAEAADVPRLMVALGVERALDVLTHTTAMIRQLETLRTAAAGVVASQSTRAHGHSGFAQKRGHRTPEALVQELTGSTRSDAVKAVRVGESLVSTVIDAQDAADENGILPGGEHDSGDQHDSGERTPVPPARPRPWHAPADDALLAAGITTAQHDAIVRGLGDPVVSAADLRAAEAELRWGEAVAGTAEGQVGKAEGDFAAAAAAAAAAVATEAWSCAVERLVEEASVRTVEELRRSARMIRDLLDAEGASRRFDERFARRSFRFWTDEDGVRRASIAFDDEGGAWTQAIIDSALRPRRGGPRFVDPDEQKLADELIADARTNDQLTYDLFIDTLRAGALADHEQVFGARQAGVRIVATASTPDASDAGRVEATGEVEGVTIEDLLAAGAYIEETGEPAPAWLAAQHICDTGMSECTIDQRGNPLDLGRESRLFSAKQKVALAIRDGGCRWRGCDRPPSYCESHHIDHHAEGGCTDIDRGILLCRYHHMQLHHGGWRITRDGLGEFLLHPPGGGTPMPLPPRLGLVYAWAGIEPPPRRFRPAA